MCAAKDGLLALSIGVGLGVLAEMMEAEVTEVVGPKRKHDPDRSVKRHDHEDGEVTLGGRRVQVSRPRVRTVDDERERPLRTRRHFPTSTAHTAGDGAGARLRIDPHAFATNWTP